VGRPYKGREDIVKSLKGVMGPTARKPGARHPGWRAVAADNVCRFYTTASDPDTIVCLGYSRNAPSIQEIFTGVGVCLA